jgi:uncharacterized protein (DUF849 family)
VLLEACLNGARSRSDHPRCPITPAELAAEAAAAVAAGAGAIHIHPRNQDGRESVEPDDVAAAVDAIGSATDVPIGVSTGAWIAAEPDGIPAAIRRWTVLPDFASVNLHEPGAIGIAELLLDREVDVEAGIWNADAAADLAESGLAERCVRILIEALDQTLDTALDVVAGIEAALIAAAPHVPRLLHGLEATTWPVLAEAAQRGYDARIGFEDSVRLPDGSTPDSNADMVRAALDLLLHR